MSDPAAIAPAAEAERILFQNEACVVINKLPGESSESPSLEFTEELFPVHRLDMPVSGCFLLARTAKAAAFLGEAFARPAGASPAPCPAKGTARVEKLYWAVVEKPRDSVIVPPSGELVHWLYEDRKANKSFAVPWEGNPSSVEGNPPPQGGQKRHGKKYWTFETTNRIVSKVHSGKPKKAVLRYRMIGEGERYLFMEIDLVTGRHHQIRAQFAAVGLHVKGDLKYGAKRSEKAGGIRLHARYLAFPNPLNSSEKISVTSPPPVMDALWQAFVDTARQ